MASSKFSLQASDVRPADGNSLTLKALEADLKIHKIMFQKEGEVDDVQILSFLEGIAEYKFKQLDPSSYSFRIEGVDGSGAAVIEQKSALAQAAPQAPSKTDAIGRENEITAKVTSAAGDLYIVLINQSTEEIIEKKFVVPAAGYSENTMTLADGLVNGDEYRVSSYLVTSVGMSAMSQGVTVGVNNIVNDLSASKVSMIAADGYFYNEVFSSMTIQRPSDIVAGDGYEMKALFERYSVDASGNTWSATKLTDISAALDLTGTGGINVAPPDAVGPGLYKVTVTASNSYMRDNSIAAKSLSSLMWNIKGSGDGSASSKVKMLPTPDQDTGYLRYHYVNADLTYHPDYHATYASGFTPFLGALPSYDLGSGEWVKLTFYWGNLAWRSSQTTVRHENKTGQNINLGELRDSNGVYRSGRNALHDHIESEFQITRTTEDATGIETSVVKSVLATLPRISSPGAISQSVTSLYSTEGGKLDLSFSSSAEFADGAAFSKFNFTVAGVSESSSTTTHTSSNASKSSSTAVVLQQPTIDYSNNKLVLSGDLVVSGEGIVTMAGDVAANLPTLGADISVIAVGKPSAPASISLTSEDGAIAGQTSYSHNQLANGQKDAVKFKFKWVDQNGDDQSDEKTYSTVWDIPTFKLYVENGVGATAEAWLVQRYDDHTGAAQTVESDRISFDTVTYAQGAPIITSVSASGKNLTVDWHGNGTLGDINLVTLALDAKPDSNDGALLKRNTVSIAGRLVRSQTTSISFSSFDSDIVKHLVYIEARHGFAGSNVASNISMA